MYISYKIMYISYKNIQIHINYITKCVFVNGFWQICIDLLKFKRTIYLFFLLTTKKKRCIIGCNLIEVFEILSHGKVRGV